MVLEGLTLVGKEQNRFRYEAAYRMSSMAQDDGAEAPRTVEFIVVRQSGRYLVESYRYPDDQSRIL